MAHHREQDAAERGWQMFLDQQGVDPGPPPAQRRARRRPPLPHALVAALASAALIAPLAVAQNGTDEPTAQAAAAGDVLRQEVRNGTTASETEIIGDFNATTGAKGGYVTRQSNTQTGPNAGGGAIYGCRGAAGGTAGGSAPCLRASNLADGLAFEFASKSGPAGLFGVASATDAPFATNGGGLVTNLNADKVDGLDAADLKGATGPKGDTGDTGLAGPKGDTGDTGPRGPSDGVNKYIDDQVQNIGVPTAIHTINLPAGSWIVNATVSGDNDDGTPAIVECSLLIGGTKVDETRVRLGPSGDAGEYHSLALTGGDTLGAAGTADLECDGSLTTDFFDPSLTAIQVETLDTQ